MAGLTAADRLCRVDFFQRVAGASRHRYFCGYLYWRLNAFNCQHPWGLETSPYEIAAGQQVRGR